MLIYAEPLCVDNERTRCVYLAWGLTKPPQLACDKGISLCKAVVIQRSKTNRLMQMNPDGLPNVILSAHTYSSFLLQRGLACKPPGEERAQELAQHVADISGQEDAALSLCRLCICFTFGHVKSTNSFIFDFRPRCLPTTSSRHSVRADGSPARVMVPARSRAGVSSRATTLPPDTAP